MPCTEVNFPTSTYPLAYPSPSSSSLLAIQNPVLVRCYIGALERWLPDLAIELMSKVYSERSETRVKPLGSRRPLPFRGFIIASNMIEPLKTAVGKHGTCESYPQRTVAPVASEGRRRFSAPPGSRIGAPHFLENLFRRQFQHICMCASRLSPGWSRELSQR